MISFGNATTSHSGLIPLKTVYKKRGELLWAIASKKNFINLHSAAFVTDFVSKLEHQIFQEIIPTLAFFKTFSLISLVLRCQTEIKKDFVLLFEPF